MNMEATSELRLDKARHVKYWTRCLKTLLPHHYTGNESNRMYLAFFIISALDLLDAWHAMTKEAERKEYIDWIYHCQHPNGGFRMWPGTDFGELSNDENAKWDPANIPATYFALAALVIVGDDLSRVRRRKTLDWLRSMQRPDGSFGETLVDGRIEGGKDPRFAYCATGVRYILRGDHEGPLEIDGASVEDVQVDKLVACVQSSECYDGGIADEAFHEPHAGYTFCSLGAMKFVNRLATNTYTSRESLTAPSHPSQTLSWLSARQTDLSDPDAELEEDPNEEQTTTGNRDSKLDITPPLHQSPDKSTVLSPFGVKPLEAGMNGRTNKVADTCYAWWAGASFHILEQPDMYSKVSLHRYLLDKTQHPALGGFGKFPGDLPDLYHSYLGLAALGLSEVEDIKEVDACMCISKEASSRLPSLWKAWQEQD